MNPRTTGVLAIVAVLLAAFVWFYEIEGETGRRAAADDEKRIHPGLESAEVEAVSFETSDGVEARFERREGRWEMVAPIVAPADAVALDAVAGALTNLTTEGRVDSPGSLDQYGLGEGARVVRFEIGGEAKGIRIGRSTPVGGHLYVAPLARDEVAYVATYRLNSFNRELADLRDRRVFGFDSGEVEALQIAWPGGEVELERDAAGIWQMTSPATARADDAAIRDLLTDLSFLRAKTFIDEPDESVDAAAGERAIEFRWTLRGSDGAPGESQRGWIGGSIGEGLLLSGPDGRLFTVDRERLDDFERSVPAYRYKILSEFDVASARRLSLAFRRPGGETTEVSSELLESGWSSPESGIDPLVVSDLVRELSQLRAVDILADEMGESELASLGLVPPRALLRVEAGVDSAPGSDHLAEVAIGRFDEERGFFAQRVGEPTIYLLEVGTADRLPVSWEAFEANFVVDDEEEPAAGEAGEELEPETLEEDPMEGVEIP